MQSAFHAAFRRKNTEKQDCVNTDLGTRTSGSVHDAEQPSKTAHSEDVVISLREMRSVRSIANRLAHQHVGWVELAQVQGASAQAAFGADNTLSQSVCLRARTHRRVGLLDTPCVSVRNPGQPHPLAVRVEARRSANAPEATNHRACPTVDRFLP
jgi:hypothetical protein